MPSTPVEVAGSKEGPQQSSRSDLGTARNQGWDLTGNSSGLNGRLLGLSLYPDHNDSARGGGGFRGLGAGRGVEQVVMVVTWWTLELSPHRGARLHAEARTTCLLTLFLRGVQL